MKFVALPLMNLRNHPTRSILTSLGIAIALAGMLALVGLSRGLERNWIVSLREKSTDIVAVQKGAIDTLSATLDETLADRVMEVSGVATATAFIGDLVDLETGEMALLSGWPADSDLWLSLVITAGRAPAKTEYDAVVLGESLAELLGRGPGDAIRLSGADFRIVAISRRPSVLDDRSVMMLMPAMQALVGREGKASGFYIRLQHPELEGEAERVQQRLRDQFPTLSFILTADIGRDTLVTRLLQAIAWSSSTIALGMAFVVILNTLLMSVTERTHEIGLLCAIGWQPARVMALIVIDGLALSSAGAILGVGLGLACIRWMTTHPRLGGLFQPDVTLGLILEGTLMTLLLGLLGGVYPAWRATRLRPIDLLRAE